MAELFEVMEGQRAHRRFSERPVDDETLAKILGAAIRAPSAQNAQPWAFIVVRRQGARERLSELAGRAWAEGGRRHAEGHLPQSMLADVEQAATGGLARAPVQIVVCADRERVQPAVTGASVFPAVQNLLLAASALGLGGVLTTLPLFYDQELRQLLALPPSFKAVAVVPLGWPARALGPGRRRPLEEVVHAEVYGARWPGAPRE